MNVSKITNKAINVIGELPQIAGKTVSSITQENNPEKLTSALDCLATNAASAVNMNAKKSNLPDFIYHITSKENYEKILKDGKMKISDWEANSGNGCNGIYFVDRENFLNKWLNRKETELFGDTDIGEMLMLWTSKSLDGSVAIKIPTSKLNPMQLRFRPYLQACRESIEAFDPDTLKIDSKMVKEGLPIDDLIKYKNSNEPIEYVYFGEITPDMFLGCTETSFSENMREMIHNLFG